MAPSHFSLFSSIPKASLRDPLTLIMQYRPKGGSLYQFWMGIRFFAFGLPLAGAYIGVLRDCNCGDPCPCL
ncbi:MAG: hypothetical protein ACUVRV_03040 [Cyanobacteriota bacterium]